MLIMVVSLGGCATSKIPEPISIETPPVIVEKAETPLTPKLSISAQAFGLSASGFDLHAQAIVINPNSVDIALDTLKLSIKGESGASYNQATIAGAKVAPNNTNTFYFYIKMSGAAVAEKTLLLSVETTARVLDTTFQVIATTSLDKANLHNLIISPKMTIRAKIMKLSQNGANMQLEGQVEINIQNPNPLKLDVNVLQVSVKNKNKETIVISNVSGSTVAPDSAHTFNGEFVLPAEASNEIPITVYVEAIGQIQQATQKVTGETALHIPGISELVSAPRITLETSGVWREMQPTPKLQLTITATINNDNVFPVDVGDIKVSLFKPRDTLLTGFSWLPITVPGSGSKTAANWVFIEKLTIGPLGGDATVAIEAQYGIKGANDKVPLKFSYVVPLKPQ